MIHPTSVVGPRVSVAEEATIGPNCYIEGKSTVGARTRFLGGIILLGDASIGEDCVVEPGVSMTSVALPEGVRAPLVLGNGVRIGAGSVLTLGVTIGNNACIGAGTIISRDVPPHAIVRGNPAAIVGYAAPSKAEADTHLERGRTQPVGSDFTICMVEGVRIYDFPRIRDLRGDLSVGEFDRNVPFQPKRYFLVFDVPSAETRGEHAHRTCEQFLVCVSGSVAVVVDDGHARRRSNSALPIAASTSRLGYGACSTNIRRAACCSSSRRTITMRKTTFVTTANSWRSAASRRNAVATLRSSAQPDLTANVVQQTRRARLKGRFWRSPAAIL